MGERFCFTCENCHHKYSADIGRGFGYGNVYRARIAAIEAGDYGLAWQEAFRNTPGAVIDADYVVYICYACKAWEVGTDLSLYAPNRSEDMSSKLDGKKTLGEAGAVQLVQYIKENKSFLGDHHLVKRYYHLCSKCGKRMHKASRNEIIELSCPKCGRKNQTDEVWMWD